MRVPVGRMWPGQRQGLQGRGDGVAGGAVVGVVVFVVVDRRVFGFRGGKGGAEEVGVGVGGVGVDGEGQDKGLGLKWAHIASSEWIAVVGVVRVGE